MDTTQHDAWQAILAEMQRRVEARPRGEVTALANLLGVTRGTVSRYLSGDLQGKRVPMDKMFWFMDRLGIDPSPWFGRGERSSDYITVPWLEATASMGGGSLEVSKDVISHLSFRTDWLISKGAPQRMVVINADGDSMEPTIPDGSVVLVNEAKTQPVNNKIFFVRYGDELFLKRLKVDPQGHVIALISDRNNQEIYLDPSESFEILGRALWYGHEL